MTSCNINPGGIIMKIELSQPLSYKDKQLTELEFDYDSLTGNDLIMAE